MDHEQSVFAKWMIDQKIVKFCREGKCTKCRFYKKLALKKLDEKSKRLEEEAKRVEEVGKRRSRIEKAKQEQEEYEQLDFSKCAQLIKEEVGGPFFSA